MKSKKDKEYSDADMKVVSEKHEWSAADFRRARPARVVLPKKFFAELESRRSRGPQKTRTKKLISLRIDPEVIERFRASGAGWQGRINVALRKAAGLK